MIIIVIITIKRQTNMTSIQEIIGKTKFTKPDLINKCKELGISGYSGLKKNALILKIEQFVVNTPFETDIELTTEEQEIVENLNENIENKDETLKNKSKTRDVETQVKPNDLKKKEDIASIHFQIIDKVKLDKTRDISKLLLKIINNSNKYKLGDIILNEIGITKYNKKECISLECLDIICRDGNGDKKKLFNFDTITTEEFIEEHSYLKNINYDTIIMDMDSKFKVEEFSSPIIDLSIFYARINEKHHMLETIYEFIDPPYPVLSTNEVIHNPNYFYY